VIDKHNEEYVFKGHEADANSFIKYAQVKPADFQGNVLDIGLATVRIRYSDRSIILMQNNLANYHP
jgi:hypothetical protein